MVYPGMYRVGVYQEGVPGYIPSFIPGFLYSFGKKERFRRPCDGVQDGNNSENKGEWGYTRA